MKEKLRFNFREILGDAHVDILTKFCLIQPDSVTRLVTIMDFVVSFANNGTFEPMSFIPQKRKRT